MEQVMNVCLLYQSFSHETQKLAKRWKGSYQLCIVLFRGRSEKVGPRTSEQCKSLIDVLILRKYLEKEMSVCWGEENRVNKSERPVDALAVKKVNHSLTYSMESRDASASKKEENILRGKIHFWEETKRRKLFGKGKLMVTPTNRSTTQPINQPTGWI